MTAPGMIFRGPHVLTLDEGQRQLALLALAHLAVERPGFDYALAEMATKIDNLDAGGRPVLYDQFRELRRSSITAGEAFR